MLEIVPRKCGILDSVDIIPEWWEYSRSVVDIYNLLALDNEDVRVRVVLLDDDKIQDRKEHNFSVEHATLQDLSKILPFPRW